MLNPAGRFEDRFDDGVYGDALGRAIEQSLPHRDADGSLSAGAIIESTAHDVAVGHRVVYLGDLSRPDEIGSAAVGLCDHPGR